MTIDIEEKLKTIWDNHKSFLDTDFTYNRRYVYAIPEKADILITGINPYDNGTDSHHFNYNNATGRYFNRLKKIEPNATYLDLFHIRGEQHVIKDMLYKNGGLSFMVDQLKLTHRLIEEVVQPELILVFNKGSWVFWGYYANSHPYIWMGYDLNLVKEMRYGRLMKVKGIIEHSDRISDISNTVLKDKLIYFSKYLGRASNKQIQALTEEIKDIKKELGLV